MKFVFSQLKKMDVVSVTDGKNLGRVFDLAITFPEGTIKGLYVTGSKGFRLTRQEEFIPLHSVVKIGEDVILVKFTRGAKEESTDNKTYPPKSYTTDEYE